jgi:hypothetical protein
MRGTKRTVLLALGVLLALSQGGCLVNRTVSTSNVLDLPNTITARGFRYVKKGIVGRHELHGILPAKLDRTQLLVALDVADEAYRRLWEAAGGLRDNQALVNLVVEVSFVQKGGELFMALGFYADKIEFEAGAPAKAHAPGRREAVLATIRAEIARALSRRAV